MENKVSADMLTIDGISFGNIELLYEEAGEYDETLVISDNSGNSSSYKLHIMVIGTSRKPVKMMWKWK